MNFNIENRNIIEDRYKPTTIKPEDNLNNQIEKDTNLKVVFNGIRLNNIFMKFRDFIHSLFDKNFKPKDPFDSDLNLNLTSLRKWKDASYKYLHNNSAIDQTSFEYTSFLTKSLETIIGEVKAEIQSRSKSASLSSDSDFPKHEPAFPLALQSTFSSSETQSDIKLQAVRSTDSPSGTQNTLAPQTPNKSVAEETRPLDNTSTEFSSDAAYIEPNPSDVTQISTGAPPVEQERSPEEKIKFVEGIIQGFIDNSKNLTNISIERQIDHFISLVTELKKKNKDTYPPQGRLSLPFVKAILNKYGELKSLMPEKFTPARKLAATNQIRSGIREKLLELSPNPPLTDLKDDDDKHPILTDNDIEAYQETSQRIQLETEQTQFLEPITKSIERYNQALESKNIEELITVQDEFRVHLNTATPEELSSVEFLGQVQSLHSDIKDKFNSLESTINNIIFDSLPDLDGNFDLVKERFEIYKQILQEHQDIHDGTDLSVYNSFIQGMNASIVQKFCSNPLTIENLEALRLFLKTDQPIYEMLKEIIILAPFTETEFSKEAFENFAQVAVAEKSTLKTIANIASNSEYYLIKDKIKEYFTLMINQNNSLAEFSKSMSGHVKGFGDIAKRFSIPLPGEHAASYETDEEFAQRLSP